MSNLTFMDNFTDTATDPATATRNVVASPINYGADWRVKVDEPGEVVLVNVSCNGATPEMARFAVSDIADIFKNASIDAPSIIPAGASFSKKGVSLLIQATMTATDASGIQYPVSAHLVLRFPSAPGIASDDMMSALGRALGHVYETGTSNPDTRLAAMSRGALKPVGL